MKGRGAWIPLALFLAATGGSAQVPVESPKAEPILARAYEVRFRPLDDAMQLLTTSQVLSSEGTVTLHPGLKTLVVQDRVSVLDRVASLLQSFDLPPRNVELTLSLVLGSDRREGAGAGPSPGGVLSREDRGIIETLGDFTKWTDYSLLGGQSLTSIEGARVELRLSADYKVTFEVSAVRDTPSGTVVSLKRFTLQRVVRTPTGSERSDDHLVIDVDVPVGKSFVLGAAKSPDSHRALFIAFRAKAD